MADQPGSRRSVFPQRPPFKWRKLFKQSNDRTPQRQSACADDPSAQYSPPVFDPTPTESTLSYQSARSDSAPWRGEAVSIGQAQHAPEVISPVRYYSQTAYPPQRVSGLTQHPCQSAPRSSHGLVCQAADGRQHNLPTRPRPETGSSWGGQQKSPRKSLSRNFSIPHRSGSEQTRDVGIDSQSGQEAPSRREEARPSLRQSRKDWRMSYWAELDAGIVHRRKLSERLNEVLDVDFQMPVLDTQFSETLDQLGELNIHGDPECDGRSDDRSNEVLGRRSFHDSSFSLVDSSSDYCDRCEHQSSEDFQIFFHEHQHRTQRESISSTRCMVSVPRARFHTNSRRGTTPQRCRPRPSSTTLGKHDVVRLSRERSLYASSIWQSRSIENGIGLIPEVPDLPTQPEPEPQQEQSQNLSRSSRLSSYSRPFYASDTNASRQSFTPDVTSTKSVAQVPPVTPPRRIRQSRHYGSQSSRGASDSSCGRLPSLHSVSTLSFSPQSYLHTPPEMPMQAYFLRQPEYPKDGTADRDSFFEDPYFEGELFEAASVVMRPVKASPVIKKTSTNTLSTMGGL